MILAGQGYTPSQPFSPWTILLGASVISLSLVLISYRIKRHYQQARPLPFPYPYLPIQARGSQYSNMAKAKPKSTTPSASPSPASACDVLKPLSRNGTFPSSGTVAARARDQVQNPGKGPGSTGLSGTAQAGAVSGSSGEASGSVQKRSESVLQMHEVGGDGVRTWRRVVVEYR